MFENKKVDDELKIEKLHHRFREGDFKTAKDICDKIEIKRIKDANDLVLISNVYEKNKEYSKAKEALKRAYKVSPMPKRLLYDLSFICIEDNDLKDAISYYKLFCDAFLDDQRRELLKYGILKRKGAQTSQLIRILEDYLTSDLSDKWLYELALQYEKNDNVSNLVLCCNKLFDMCGVEEYGKKALQLKQKYEELSIEQKNAIEENLNRNKEKSTNEFIAASDNIYGEDIFDTEDSPKTEKVDNYAEGRNAVYTFDKVDKKQYEDITPIKNDEEKNVEKEDKDSIFTNMQKTNLGVEDEYMPDVEEYFSNDSEDFKFAFNNEENDRQNINNEKLEDDVSNSDMEDKNTILLTVDDNFRLPKNDNINTEISASNDEEENKPGIVISDDPTRPKLSIPLRAVETFGKENNIVKLNEEASPVKEEVEKIKSEEEKLFEIEKEEIDDKDKKTKKIVTLNMPKRKSIFNLTEKEIDMRLSDLKKNMIIEAMTKEAGIKIATTELNYIRKAMGMKRAVAKTNAYNINEKGFSYYKSKLAENDLIVENAGRLTDRAIDDIEEFILNNQNIVCLVDVKDNFDDMAERRKLFVERFDIISDIDVDENTKEPKVNLQNKNIQIEASYLKNRESNKNSIYDDLFANVGKMEESKAVENSSIKHLHEEDDNANGEKVESRVVNRISDYDNKKQIFEEERIQSTNTKMDTKADANIEEFITICRNYAARIDCSIPGESINALYEKSRELLSEGYKLNKENAVELIEAAADRAEKVKFPFGKKLYDKNGCLIIKEEDIRKCI